jgi:hypothetical protein
MSVYIQQKQIGDAESGGRDLAVAANSNTYVSGL